MPALRREWLAARIVAAVGVLLLAVVVAGVVADLWFAQPTVAPAPAAARAAAPNAEARRQEDIALCTAALVSAQTLGIVPGFAVRDGDETRTTNVQGRYVCGARTDAAKYTIVFDLACRNLGQSNCIVPFQIVQQGGGVIYQRPN